MTAPPATSSRATRLRPLSGLVVPTWNADQYLLFDDERTRPCRDLVARIALASPRRVIDLGCGPGNSTDVLAGRWPDAELTGIDSSRAMIDAATRSHPARRWRIGDIAVWSREDEPFDLVFSNAALHWVHDHATVFPRLLERAAPGGALALQMPTNHHDGPAHRLMREVAASERWRGALAGVRSWQVQAAEFYYDALAPGSARIDLWETEYVHVMPGPEAIVEWYKGSGLRPFLDALPSDSERAEFTADYLARIREAFPRRADGKVLFPFRRLFVVAYR